MVSATPSSAQPDKLLVGFTDGDEMALLGPDRIYQRQHGQWVRLNHSERRVLADEDVTSYLASSHAWMVKQQRGPLPDVIEVPPEPQPAAAESGSLFSPLAISVLVAALVAGVVVGLIVAALVMAHLG